jgi:methionyl-tRNA synthetase
VIGHQGEAALPPISIVTAAPPTPNGELHLGHLSGPYSGADIHARAARLLGRTGLYLTGSDVHQSYVPLKARELREDPLVMADRFADEIAGAFSAMSIETTACVRPQHTRLHSEIVQDFV